MACVKFNGLLKEVVVQYPNIDLVEFLLDTLQLPLFKAEELAARIEKQYCSTTNCPQKPVRSILIKPVIAEASPQNCVYSVDCLSEKEFEHFIKWLLEEMGYRVEAESYPAALGVDLVATKDGARITVNARRYPKHLKVSDPIVLTAQNAKRIYECNKALVIATAYFTDGAVADAQKSDIELWDIEALEDKINQAAKKVKANSQSTFPQYKNSLMQSLFSLNETKDFIVEPRAAEKYDLLLPGVKYPLLTFQVSGNSVVGCVYRIKYNEPMAESDGEVLIKCEGGCRMGPEDAQAYALIIEYLEQFIE